MSDQSHRSDPLNRAAQKLLQQEHAEVPDLMPVIALAMYGIREEDPENPLQDDDPALLRLVAFGANPRYEALALKRVRRTLEAGDLQGDPKEVGREIASTLL